MIPVRIEAMSSRPPVVRVYEPLAADSHMLARACPACDALFAAGETLVLIYIGPGPDPEDQQRFRDGRAHTGCAVALHIECAGQVP